MIDLFWISRESNEIVEYLYEYNQEHPELSTWGKYLKFSDTDDEKVIKIFEVLEQHFENVEFMVFDENDDKFKYAKAMINSNVGVNVYGNNLPKNINEYCNFCRHDCKLPGFVKIEICPDFVEK